MSTYVNAPLINYAALVALDQAAAAMDVKIDVLVDGTQAAADHGASSADLALLALYFEEAMS